MALLSKDPKGNRTIQFTAGDRKRRTIRLGKITQKLADSINVRVELLNMAAISNSAVDPETAAWVGKLEPTLYDKLAKEGLVHGRIAAPKLNLEAFLAEYSTLRADVKRSTALVYRHTTNCLLGYFGSARPLSQISAGDADKWRLWLAITGKWADGSVRKKLGENTIRRRCGVARQFFCAAMRERLIAENPFGEMKGISVRSNRERDYHITREDAAKVIDACPDAQWRLIFALARYGGLRCPSEVLALTWGDVD